MKENENLKEKDLEKGEYYYYRWTNSSGNGGSAIFLNLIPRRAILHGKEYRRNLSITPGGGNTKELRHATNQERKHLEACIAAEKFVKCPPMYYEIY